MNFGFFLVGVSWKLSALALCQGVSRGSWALKYYSSSPWVSSDKQGNPCELVEVELTNTTCSGDICLRQTRA